MKTLSLTQPWATLIAIGAKKIESRSWYTPYRGPLLIHAAKSYPRWARETCEGEPFKSILAAAGITNIRHGFPFGAIIAKCHLSAIVTTEGGLYLSDQERAFGDYSPGRYAWFLENVERLPEPIPARGMLQLWEFPFERAGKEGK